MIVAKGSLDQIGNITVDQRAETVIGSEEIKLCFSRKLHLRCNKSEKKTKGWWWSQCRTFSEVEVYGVGREMFFFSSRIYCQGKGELLWIKKLALSSICLFWQNKYCPWSTWRFGMGGRVTTINDIFDNNDRGVRGGFIIVSFYEMDRRLCKNRRLDLEPLN